MAGSKEHVEVIRDAAEPVLLAMAGPNARGEVEDLLASITERILKKLAAGQRIDDLALYAKQSARNAFNDWLRRKHREQGNVPIDGRLDDYGRDLADTLVSTSLSPSSLAVIRDDQRRHNPMIYEAFADLSASERAVLDLRFKEGLSSAEVAEQLGYKSAQVVDTVACRARSKIKRKLSPSLLVLVGGA